MSYSKIPSRTTSDANAASDLNQAQLNIESLKGGDPAAAPVSDIATLYDALSSLISVYKKPDIDALIIKPNATNYNYQLDVSANGLRVEDLYLTSVSITIDLTTLLDTGTEAVSTWYYVWVFANSSSDYCFRFSASSTAPTVPSGYTRKRLIGVVRNDASGNFQTFYQRDKLVHVNYVAVLSAGAATARTGVTVSAFIPHLISSKVNIDVHQGVAAKYTYISPNNSTLGEQVNYSAYILRTSIILKLITDKIYYYATATGSTSIYLTSYELNI